MKSSEIYNLPSHVVLGRYKSKMKTLMSIVLYDSLEQFNTKYRKHENMQIKNDEVKSIHCYMEYLINESDDRLHVEYLKQLCVWDNHDKTKLSLTYIKTFLTNVVAESIIRYTNLTGPVYNIEKLYEFCCIIINNITEINSDAVDM